jgi:diacylglycerol kinase (ATP)
MSQPCTILLNNRAGALHATATEEQMRAMVSEVGIDAEVVGTSSVDEMLAIIRRLKDEKARCVAVAGGDGTVARAVQELAHSETTLAIIPQGTFNNFATALRLPLDLPSALRVIGDGVERQVDLGKVFNHYFTEAAGVGLFADALALYGKGTNKNLVRGIRALGRVLLSFRAYRLNLTIDGQKYSERSVMCTVANSYRMSSGVSVAPGARLTDGELDLVVVGDLKRAEILQYYRAFRAQMHLNLPKVTTLRAREVRFESRHRLNVHCDDQFVGTTPAAVTAQPGALKVLVEPL